MSAPDEKPPGYYHPAWVELRKIFKPVIQYVEIEVLKDKNRHLMRHVWFAYTIATLLLVSNVAQMIKHWN